MDETKYKETIVLPLALPKRGPGRPPTFAAKSNAERQKTYRDKKRKAKMDVSNDNVTENSQPVSADLAKSIARSQVSLLQGELAALTRENALLVQDRGDAGVTIEELRADQQSTAQSTSSTRGHWEQRSATLQHELDIAKLMLKEQIRTTERLKLEAGPLRDELTRLRTAAKRTATNMVKWQDLRDRNEALYKEVAFLTSEVKRLTQK